MDNNEQERVHGAIQIIPSGHIQAFDFIHQEFKIVRAVLEIARSTAPSPASVFRASDFGFNASTAVPTQ